MIRLLRPVTATYRPDPSERYAVRRKWSVAMVDADTLWLAMVDAHAACGPRCNTCNGDEMAHDRCDTARRRFGRMVDEGRAPWPVPGEPTGGQYRPEGHGAPVR